MAENQTSQPKINLLPITDNEAMILGALLEAMTTVAHDDSPLFNITLKPVLSGILGKIRGGENEAKK